MQIVFEKKLMHPLYEVNNKKIYYSDCVDALRRLGIAEGDTVFVHSDISVFGKLCAGNKDFLLKTLIDAIKESVGDKGTIIMPTFSYSFCRGEDYDVTKSKSSVGILTEYFRQQADVLRTVHPMFSVALWGCNKEYFSSNLSRDSFGKGTIFEKLHLKKGKIIFFGAPFQACTYLHYIEQMHGIPYRYLKTFKGTIINGDATQEDEYTFFVRDLDENVAMDAARLEKHLLGQKLLKETRLGKGRILLIEADLLFREGCKLLDQDIHFFLKVK